MAQRANGTSSLPALVFSMLAPWLAPVAISEDAPRADPQAPAQSQDGASETDAEPSGLLKLLLDLHEAEPDNSVVIYTLARHFYGSKRTDEAQSWLRRLETSPWDDVLERADFPNLAEHPDLVRLADRLDKRARIVHNAEVVFELDIPDLAPEGTAWDPRRREVLLSSGHKRKVVAVDSRGRVRDLTTEAQDGLWAVLGMEVDDQDRLWVASTAAPFMRGYAPELAGRASIHAIDLASGETVGEWDADQTPALLNDLTIAQAGTVYVTDSQNGRVLALDSKARSWTPIGARVDFIGLNGVALSGGEDQLFVTDFLGLTRIDLATRKAERLPTPPGVSSLGGIDGLRYFSGSLIAIQNVVGTGRVWRIALDPAERSLEGAELLEAGNPDFQNPTTGAIADDTFVFLANPSLQVAGNDGLGPRPEDGRFKLLRLPLANTAATH